MLRSNNVTSNVDSDKKDETDNPLSGAIFKRTEPRQESDLPISERIDNMAKSMMNLEHPRAF